MDYAKIYFSNFNSNFDLNLEESDKSLISLIKNSLNHNELWQEKKFRR